MSKGKQPDFDAFVTTENGDDTIWHRIGAAWNHKEGGLTIRLNYPVGVTELVLRAPKKD